MPLSAFKIPLILLGLLFTAIYPLFTLTIVK